MSNVVNCAKLINNKLVLIEWKSGKSKQADPGLEGISLRMFTDKKLVTILTHCIPPEFLYSFHRSVRYLEK